MAIAARKRALDFSTRRYAENFVDTLRSAVQTFPKFKKSADAVL
jgi:hypothetical protein